MKRILASAAVALALLAAMTLKLRAQDFEALARDVVQELSARQYDKVEARFDATMAAAMPLEKLQSFWDATLAQTGAFKAVTGVTSAEYQGYHVVTLACAFEKAPLNLRFAFDKDSKIAGFSSSRLRLPGVLLLTRTPALSTSAASPLPAALGNCPAR